MKLTCPGVLLNLKWLRLFCNNDVRDIIFPYQIIEIVEIFINKFVVLAVIRS